MQASLDLDIDHPYEVPPRASSLADAVGAHPLGLWAQDNPLPELIAAAEASHAGVRLRMALESLKGGIRTATDRVQRDLGVAEPPWAVDRFIWSSVMGEGPAVRRGYVTSNGHSFDALELTCSQVFEADEVAQRLASFQAEKAGLDRSQLALSQNILDRVYGVEGLRP